LFQGDPNDQAMPLTLSALAASSVTKFGGEIKPHIVVKSTQHAEPLGRDTSILIDQGGEIHRTYGALKPSMFLIRPDGYIGMRSDAPKDTALAKYLNRIFDLEAARDKLRHPAISQAEGKR
jgi:hypothetical protein